MKSLLFLALCDINDMSNGVTLKVRSQIEALKSLGYQITSATYDFNHISIQNNLNSVHKESKNRRKDLFKEVIQVIQSSHFDICFIRFPHFDLRFMNILKALKKNGVRTYLEIPSYPINYPKKSLSATYFRFWDTINYSLIKKYVYQILAVGNPSDQIFGVRSHSIPNGYMQATKETDMYACSSNQIDILSISSFYDIHGLDRLVEGYNQYINSADHQLKVYVHLVGEGPHKSRLIDRVNELNLNEYIKFYPSMSQDELSGLYKTVNMGCAPLATHRTNYKYASPLKTKDYFQRGLPYFCAYEEIGIDPNYPYVLKFPLDESPIDFNRIVSFYQSYQPNCERVRLDMQMYGEKQFNWKNIFSIIE